MEEKLKKIRELLDIQGKTLDGEQSEYHRGLYNGLELALCVFEERQPMFNYPSKQAIAAALTEKGYCHRGLKKPCVCGHEAIEEVVSKQEIEYLAKNETAR